MPWQWWETWCAREGVDPQRPTVGTLADAMLDARLAGWSDRELARLLDTVGPRGGLWRDERWIRLRLGLRD